MDIYLVFGGWAVAQRGMDGARPVGVTHRLHHALPDLALQEDVNKLVRKIDWRVSGARSCGDRPCRACLYHAHGVVDEITHKGD